MACKVSSMQITWARWSLAAGSFADLKSRNSSSTRWWSASSKAIASWAMVCLLFAKARLVLPTAGVCRLMLVNPVSKLAVAAAWAALASVALAGPSHAAQDARVVPTVPSTRECGAPPRLEDGWTVADAQQQGFDPGRLCGAVHAFRASALNLHGLVIERGGKLVAESYRTGRDIPWLFVVPRQVAFGPGTLHDLRSISKSVVSLLWGIAQPEAHLPPVHT